MGEINKVGIIGAGEIATKIEKLLSKAGVKVISAKEGQTEKLSDADLIVEALLGDVEPRKEALSKCDKETPPNTILATTASWGITEIAAATKRVDRVIGLNFTFNPVEDKCLVQITKTLETSKETVQACKSLGEKTGAKVVEIEDSPGLILDRVMASIINEAATMYASKLATIEDIDKAVKLCLNWAMGPFEFADAIGIDNVVATLEVLSQRKGPQYLPSRVLTQMVALGRLGKKTGKGFHTYS